MRRFPRCLTVHSAARPCQRCIKRGIADNCTEGHRKKAKYLLDEEELGGSPHPPKTGTKNLSRAAEELKRHKSSAPESSVEPTSASGSVLEQASIQTSNICTPHPPVPSNICLSKRNHSHQTTHYLPFPSTPPTFLSDQKPPT